MYATVTTVKIFNSKIATKGLVGCLRVTQRGGAGKGKDWRKNCLGRKRRWRSLVDHNDSPVIVGRHAGAFWDRQYEEGPLI